MTVEIRTPTDDDTAELFAADGRNFGFDYTPTMIEQRRPALDFGRFRIATEGGRIVGVCGSYEFDMTVPGGAALPTGGITWVSVNTTHRRQGLMSRLITACHEDIAGRSEPLAALGASEGTIYERFGYGISSHTRTTSVDRRLSRLRPQHVPPPGGVRYTDDAEARTLLPELWDRFRRMRPCEISRPGALWEMLFQIRADSQGELTRAHYLVHADGYLSYRRCEEWKDGMAMHRAEVGDFVALTPDAYLALWSTLLGLDLVAEITVHDRPLDDPLEFFLDNPRSVRTKRLGDGVWTKVLDPLRCFSARTYGSSDRLVIEAGDDRFAIESCDGEVGCEGTDEPADLVIDPARLGTLLMGGVRPSVLAGGRLLTATSSAVLRRADHFFLGDVLPHCQTGF